MFAKGGVIGFIVLGVGVMTYSVLIWNADRNYTWEINNEEGNLKVYGRQNYTQSMRLRAEQCHLRCEELMLDQNQRPFRIRNSQFIVNDEHKIVYCMIPKVACTNLRRVFIILNETMNQTDPVKITAQEVIQYEKYLTRLHTYSSEEIEYRLQNYRKVLFVREPFERILSAYRNKFVNQKWGIRKKYEAEIIKTFRSNTSEESARLGKDVTFSEFVQFLIKLHKNNEPFNQHWATYSELCSPCKVQYDFIGRFETLDDDVDFLLESIGVGDTLRFPRRNETYNKTTKTNDVLYEFYRDIEPKNIEKIREIYANDFKLFDYALPAGIMKILREK